MVATQSTQESQGIDTAQSTADLEGFGTLCSIDKKFLTPDHEAHIAGRGLLNDWARACCHSASIAQTSLYLGYEAGSAGILFIGKNGQVQFRPDIREPKRGKKEPPKYLSPRGEFDAFLPPSPDNPLYWEIEALKREAFYINDVPYILITEGVFKALAGCSNGIPTISLLGVEQGLTGKARDRESLRHLVPALRKLAEAGFGFIIAFDADALDNLNIQKAERKLAKQLAKFDVPVRSITGAWPAASVIESGEVKNTKGMDDFIEHKGIEEFRAILSKAKLFGKGENDDTEESKKSKIPSSDSMARKIAEDYRDKLAFNNEVRCWYRYEAESPGIWAPETDEYIESIIYQIIKSKGIINIPPSYIGATVRFLRHELIERKWKPRTDLLPFQNGALEIATGKLYAHSPGYKFTWALPRPHSIIDTEWGKIRKWLDFATHGNIHVQNLLLAFAAATLKGRADIQKFLHLIGIGGSGKGTFCRLLIALIGLENCHSSTLEDWCTNRFEAAQAYSKRLLIFPDEDKGMRSLGKFKQLTGGDWLRAEEKGKKPFKFKFEGMVVVASNFPIFGADNSSGMSRRTIAVPFDAVIARNARRNLDNDFAPELAAFTNYLLSLDDAWVEGILRGVMEVPEVGAQFWESKIREDSIAGFLNDKLILDPLAQISIGDSPNAEGSLYQAYHQYCSDQGHKPQAVKNFSPNLIECASVILGWQVEKIHTKIGKIIKGIRLRSKGDEHIPTYDYELQSRCEKRGDGYGDGSVTDTVTGQNPEPEPITDSVTDKPLIRMEKNIGIEIQIKQSSNGFSNEEINNTQSEIALNPSPYPEPLPVASPDQSPHPSPNPSPYPSPTPRSHAPLEPETLPTAPTTPQIAPLESKPTEPPHAPMVNWNVGERVKVSVQYPTQEYIDERATVVKVWPDGLCRIELDREISVIGGKPTKQFNLNGRYLVSESATDSNLKEGELELVNLMRFAVTQSDPLVTDAVKKCLTETCDKGFANRKKVWGALTASERTVFKALLAELEAQPQPKQLPHTPAPEESEPKTLSAPIELSKQEWEQPTTEAVTQGEPILTPTPEQLSVPIASEDLEPEPELPIFTAETEAHQLNLLPEFKPLSDSDGRFSPDSEDWL